MKKVFGILAIAGTLVACKGKTNTVNDTKVLSAADSVKMKEFEKWKQAKEQPQKTVVVYRDANAPATNTTNTTTTKKKGWSKAAQGAVIGGATGAVAGAIITKKNKGTGAAVGAVVGAGAGYGIGRAKDKKDGRVKNK